MDSPGFVRPAGNGPKGETGTTVKYQKTGGFLKPNGALIPPPQDAAQHRMGVEVHQVFRIAGVLVKNKISPGTFLRQQRKGMEQKKLMESLGLGAEREIGV